MKILKLWTLAFSVAFFSPSALYASNEIAQIENFFNKPIFQRNYITQYPNKVACGVSNGVEDDGAGDLQISVLDLRVGYDRDFPDSTATFLLHPSDRRLQKFDIQKNYMYVQLQKGLLVHNTLEVHILKYDAEHPENNSYSITVQDGLKKKTCIANPPWLFTNR